MYIRAHRHTAQTKRMQNMLRMGMEERCIPLFFPAKIWILQKCASSVWGELHARRAPVIQTDDDLMSAHDQLVPWREHAKRLSRWANTLFLLEHCGQLATVCAVRKMCTQRVRCEQPLWRTTRCYHGSCTVITPNKFINHTVTTLWSWHCL